MAMVAVAPCLYFLSVGPMVYCDRRNLWSEQTRDVVEKIYIPLEWTAKRTPLKKPLDAYVDWWEKVAKRP